MIARRRDAKSVQTNPSSHILTRHNTYDQCVWTIQITKMCMLSTYVVCCLVERMSSPAAATQSVLFVCQSYLLQLWETINYLSFVALWEKNVFGKGTLTIFHTQHWEFMLWQSVAMLWVERWQTTHNAVNCKAHKSSQSRSVFNCQTIQSTSVLIILLNSNC